MTARRPRRTTPRAQSLFGPALPASPCDCSNRRMLFIGARRAPLAARRSLEGGTPVGPRQGLVGNPGGTAPAAADMHRDGPAPLRQAASHRHEGGGVAGDVRALPAHQTVAHEVHARGEDAPDKCLRERSGAGRAFWGGRSGARSCSRPAGGSASRPCAPERVARLCRVVGAPSAAPRRRAPPRTPRRRRRRSPRPAGWTRRPRRPPRSGRRPRPTPSDGGRPAPTRSGAGVAAPLRRATRARRPRPGRARRSPTRPCAS